MRKFIQFADKPWASIALNDLLKYREKLAEGKVSPASVNRAFSSIKSFYKWAVRAHPNEFIDPTIGIELKTLPEPQAQDLSDEEVAALRDALYSRGSTQVRDRALLAVLEHGLRVSEVSGLNVEDYDGERLHIKQAKADSTGTVPLLNHARESLDLYLELRKQEGELDGDKPLFVTEMKGRKKERLGDRGIRLIIGGLAKIAGLEGITPHRLRHTFATRLALMGIDSLHSRTLTRHKDERSFKRYAKRALSVSAEKAFLEAHGEGEGVNRSSPNL